MSLVRRTISIVILALLTAGYAGSQYCTLTGQATWWAKKIDQPGVVMLSLVLFIASFALAFMPEKGDRGAKSP